MFLLETILEFLLKFIFEKKAKVSAYLLGGELTDRWLNRRTVKRELLGMLRTEIVVCYVQLLSSAAQFLEAFDAFFELVQSFCRGMKVR